jgi:hypothetical protein
VTRNYHKANRALLQRRVGGLKPIKPLGIQQQRQQIGLIADFKFPLDILRKLASLMLVHGSQIHLETVE